MIADGPLFLSEVCTVYTTVYGTINDFEEARFAHAIRLSEKINPIGEGESTCR